MGTGSGVGVAGSGVRVAGSSIGVGAPCLDPESWGGSGETRRIVGEWGWARVRSGEPGHIGQGGVRGVGRLGRLAPSANWAKA